MYLEFIKNHKLLDDIFIDLFNKQLFSNPKGQKDLPEVGQLQKVVS